MILVAYLNLTQKKWTVNISDFQSMFDVPEKCIQQVQLQIPVPVGATVGFEVVNHTIQSQVASCTSRERKGAKELQGYPKNPHKFIGSVTWSTHLRQKTAVLGLRFDLSFGDFLYTEWGSHDGKAPFKGTIFWEIFVGDVFSFRVEVEQLGCSPLAEEGFFLGTSRSSKHPFNVGARFCQKLWRGTVSFFENSCPKSIL